MKLEKQVGDALDTRLPHEFWAEQKAKVLISSNFLLSLTDIEVLLQFRFIVPNEGMVSRNTSEQSDRQL